jgi:hypothetical protein
MRTMLPSGIATLLWCHLAVHSALAVVCVHGAVQFSSPKNHAQPLGLFNERSVNETCSGAVPDVTLAEKSGIMGLVTVDTRVMVYI